MLLASALGGGYLYLDYAEHFSPPTTPSSPRGSSRIAPKVSGYITAVPVTDNQHVNAGDVIARIDDRDYRIALAQAEAQVAAAQASIENIDAQLDVQQAQIAANQAQVDQAQAALVFARAAGGALPAPGANGLRHRSERPAVHARSCTSSRLRWRARKRRLKLAQRQVEALKAQRNSAVASLAQAKAQRDQAQLNLSYTTVTAAQPGRVVNLTAAVGQFAQPGTSLTMFVPDEIWVTANFKETQLDHMRPGEPVTLAIDAYPERDDPRPCRQRPARIRHRVLAAAGRRMPPATTSRSSSACRSRSSWTIRRPTSRSARACRWSRPCAIDPTPSLYERLRRWL